MTFSRIQFKAKFSFPPIQLFLRQGHSRFNTYLTSKPVIHSFNQNSNISRSRQAKMSGKRSYKACSEAEYIPFQPKKHLLQEPPEKCYTMEELGYNNNSGISPLAVSSPFRLFTEEAVQLMREEIFNEEVHERFTFTSDLAAKQLRGYAPSYVKAPLWF